MADDTAAGSDDDDDGSDGDWFEAAFAADDDDDASETDDASDVDADAPPDADIGRARDEPSTAADADSADPETFATAFGTEDDTPSGDGPGSEEGLFDDDFADAFAGADSTPAQPPDGLADDNSGGTRTFGFDVEGTDAPGGGGDFEDPEFDSDIPRINVGIEGLDEMVQGGVPERSLLVAVGEAGTGKTTFGLQFLHEALSNGERAVFITLEESRGRVIQSADEKGWAFSEHADRGNLAVVDIDPIEMANSLTSIRNELPRLVEEFGASRLVLDSVSLLEMMYDDQSTRRTEIYDFTTALKEAGVTTMLTSEASEDNPFASRYGVIEYLTDAVVVLRYIRPEDFRETRLAVEIQKIRDANHSRETKPYEITHEGISVYRQANIF
ncbi:MULTISPECIES: KaiC domain-containing protein [Halobacterium]|uniref:KaiC domain-containing protein n=1 Tax=Halobacterium TaxID=2239 RepID=UPI0019631CCF|nr:MULTISPECIES: KaiC domain-containing protein [Halobacterium]MDL0121864.1 KaiC domain-containing protein [Halobacterium salinarum]QRY24232.1 KaiC domain-containing protein [Halobacterium sp. BOL4-2]